jgi:hypothetical protein
LSGTVMYAAATSHVGDADESEETDGP